MNRKTLRATHGGELNIAGVNIPCYVLEDGTRVLTQFGFYRAIGRSGKPARGRGSSFENIAPFLALQNLKPFINEELVDSTRPIQFSPPKGGPAWGYRAEILPRVCEVYLQARDKNALWKEQEKFATACDLIMRGLAHIGIIALVDEATGYQNVRKRDALQEILDKFIATEVRKWIKTFPDEFYSELFRLKGWQPNPEALYKRPSVVGHITNNLIYKRLAPGVLDELRKLNPTNEKGIRKHRHPQWLSEDIGHPRLREHITAVIVLMRASPNWRKFMSLAERALPEWDKTLPMPLDDDD
jgi:hypothetical protein